MARPECRGSGRRRRGGEPTGRRLRSPRAGTRGRGVGRTGAQPGGARPEPARRGRCGGPRASPLPAAQRMREPPESRCGGRHKVSRNEGRAGPRPPGSASPRRGRVRAKSRPPPGPCPGPRPPTGSAPRRLALRPPARLPASAGYPPRAPLLLPSARARGGPRARSLRPAALSRGGGGPLGAGEGPPRERLAAGGGEAGGGRAERRAARVRIAPSAAQRSCGARTPAVLDAPRVGRSLESPVFHNLRPLWSPLRGWGGGAGVVYWGTFWLREG